MATLFMDSFDIYADAADAIVGGWTNENANQTFSTSNGRFGGGCLQNGVTTSGWHAPAVVATGGTVIVAFAYWANHTGGGAADTLIEGRDRAGARLFRLEHNTSGDLKAYNQPNTQVGSTASAAIATSTWVWIEMKVVLGTGAADGSIEVQVNGSTVIGPVTSIDTNNGNALASIAFLGTAGDSRFDDVIIMDGTGTGMNAFLGDTKIDAFVPNNDGTEVDWAASTGSDYQCVDDGLANSNGDTDYVSSATATDKTDLQMGNFADNPPSAHCVQIRTRSRKTDAGDRTYRANLLSGGSTGNGTTVGLTTNYAWRRNGVFSRNPNGNVTWNKNAVNAAQVQLELIS